MGRGTFARAARVLAGFAAALALSQAAKAAPDAYITHISNGIDPGFLTVVDIATKSVVATIDVGVALEAVAMEKGGRYLWVADRVGDVYKIDTSTRTVAAGPIDVGASGLPLGIAVDPAGAFVYVANSFSDTVAVIRTSDNTVLSPQIAVGAVPHGIAVDPTGTWVYVTNEADDNVSVISTATKAVVATIPVASDPIGVIFNPSGTRAYVANNFSDDITVIDAATQSVLGAPIPVSPGPFGLAVSPDGKRLYASNCCSDKVTEIDIQGDANVVTDTVDVQMSPEGISIEPLGRYVLAVNVEEPSLSFIDTSTSPKTVTNLPLPPLLNSTFGLFITPGPPGAPAAPTATAGNAQATVAFTAPLDGGSPITGYTVTSIPPGGVDSNAGTTATTHVITGLTNGTSYTFTVAATNAFGTGAASVPSNAVTPATVPSAPSAVSATAGNAQATVTFAAPASDGGSPITGYTVISIPPGGVDGSAGTTATSHVITGLTNGISYTFTVTATNAVGTGPASAPSNAVTPATVPAAPSAVSATAGNAQATVTFTASASNGGSPITGYAVTSIPAGGVDINAGTTATSHVITGLANGTAYTFTVTASNAVGTSAPSAPSNSVTPLAPPGVPGAPTAVAATAGNAQATVTFAAPASNGGSPITGYTVISIPPGGVDGNAGTIATSHVITGLTNGVSYTFTVIATNAVGPGPASAPSNAVTPATVPGAPLAVAAIAGNAQATVTFTAPASNGGSAITGYTVTSIPSGGVDADAGTTATTHLITGLANGTAYTFTVTARNALGTGPASTPSNSVVPTNRTFSGATATGTGTATVSFTTPDAGCSFAPQGNGPLQSAFFIPLAGHPKSPPSGSAPQGVDFPHGLLDFVLIGCAPGAAVTLTMTYPAALPGTTRYWKYGPTAATPAPHWYPLPAAIAGNSITFTIVDGGLGDDDLAANGAIVDQGGPGVGGVDTHNVPTLSEAALAALALLLALTGARRRTRY